MFHRGEKGQGFPTLWPRGEGDWGALWHLTKETSSESKVWWSCPSDFKGIACLHKGPGRSSQSTRKKLKEQQEVGTMGKGEGSGPGEGLPV